MFTKKKKNAVQRVCDMQMYVRTPHARQFLPFSALAGLCVWKWISPA